MIDEDQVRKGLLAKRAELVQRVGATQATERQEVATGQNDNAQLWEVSDIRDDLDSQAATELAAQAPALRERFRPSTFDIRYSAVLRFAFNCIFI